MKLELQVPVPKANLGNARFGAWQVRERKKKAYWRELDLIRGSHLVPRGWPGGVTPELVELRLHARLWNTMDPDGLVSRAKWMLDWLHRRGYIVDDKPKHLRWKDMPTQVVDRKAPGWFHVTLTVVTGTTTQGAG